MSTRAIPYFLSLRTFHMEIPDISNFTVMFLQGNRWWLLGNTGGSRLSAPQKSSFYLSIRSLLNRSYFQCFKLFNEKRCCAVAGTHPTMQYRGGSWDKFRWGSWRWEPNLKGPPHMNGPKRSCNYETTHFMYIFVWLIAKQEKKRRLKTPEQSQHWALRELRASDWAVA